jgi:hypothetical protein
MVMMNLDSAMDNFVEYSEQRDIYIRLFTFSFASIGFLEIVRRQTSEIQVLQLVPGYYLFLIFCCFLFLLFFSDHLGHNQLELDEEIKYGVKSKNKMMTSIGGKISVSLCFLTLFLTVNNVIPISFDSFERYTQGTLEDTWSVDEIIGLEILFLFLLLTISQFPLIILTKSNTENFVAFFPEFWRPLSFVTITVSGFLTPTIDGATQLYFAGSILSFYFFMVNVLEKKVTFKDPSILSFVTFLLSLNPTFSFLERKFT